MNANEPAYGEINTDAAMIAASLGLDAPGVLEAMRAGRLAARCEGSVGEDAGRHLVTFYHRDMRLRLTVDAGGQIRERSVWRLRKALWMTSASRTAHVKS